MTVRPAFEPPRREQEQEAGRLVLRDGSRLLVWRVLAEDVRRIDAFLRKLGKNERQEIGMSLGLQDGLRDFVEHLKAPDGGQAFLVEGAGGNGVVAFGAYRLLAEGHEASITLAVDPGYRGQGLASLLLERLAVLAVHRGVERLLGRAVPENEPLFEVFRRSGFEVEERREGGMVVLSADIRSVRSRGDAPGRGLDSRILAAWSLRPLFFPRSVAVVGASRDPGGIGHKILAALVDARYRGTVYPVNPHADQVLSIRAYPSVLAIGEPVDLAIVAIPAEAVINVVEECAAAGVRGLVVVSAGFAEIGSEGRARQRELVDRVRSVGMRMIGPNCLGILHTHPEVRLNASFAPEMPPPGTVALCSQSGALGVAIIALARRVGLGLSSFVSVGNKADVADDDLLEYWEEDDGARVLLFYMESFARPRRFGRIARRVGRTKPIVVVKAGRTEAGGRAAGSHTAALTATETAVDALFRQTGIIRADTLEEMFGIARALTQQPLPRGRRAGIVSNAGGPAILCADALETAGLEVVSLAERTRAALSRILPASAAVGNPIDMIATAGIDAYRRAIEIMLGADEIDALVVMHTPVGTADTAAVEKAIGQAVEAVRGSGCPDKPVLASVVGGDGDVHAIATGGTEIPVYPFPEMIGKVMGKIVSYAEWQAAEPGAFPDFENQDLPAARKICQDALAERGDGWLTVAEARAVLERGGLVLAEGGVATTEGEAADLADRIGYPVAVKLASTQIVHKTDVGGVKLGLAGPGEVRAAFEDIRRTLEAQERAAAMQGVLVQPMLAGTAEVMLGMTQDHVFGPVLAFGMGGIHVEILRDVAFRVVPLTDVDAADMIREIRGYRLLQGYRGHPAGDVPALEEALLRLSRVVETIEVISEIDLNPVFALEPGKGYRIVDARIRVAAITDLVEGRDRLRA
jgi:acetyl coenzyme A synthetase (ADP forming)-like protein